MALLAAGLLSIPSAYSEATAPEDLPDVSKAPFKVRVIEAGDLKAYFRPLYTTYGNPGDYETGPGGSLDGVGKLILTRTDFTVGCSGALLSTGIHVLTAAHCVTDNNGNLNLVSGDVTFEGDSSTVSIAVNAGATSVHPDWDGDILRGNDVAVLNLVSIAPSDITRYDIDRNGNDDIGAVGSKAGYGKSGNGNDGDVLGWGTKRDGQNKYDDTADTMLKALRLKPGKDFASGSVLQYDFDNGKSQNDAFGFFFNKHDLGLGQPEVNSAPGDSGGPTLTNGVVSGITSYGVRLQTVFGASSDIDGELNSSFGEFSGDTRVAKYASFIDGVTVGSDDGSGGGEQGITVTAITPNQVSKGSSLSVSIGGTAFQSGATVSLANGCGPTPTLSNVAVSSETQITATITAKNNGPQRNCSFDVIVTNPDGSSGVLSKGFTVIA